MVRRLRMVSQTISGRPRVTVRAYYEGLPSMAGRGTDEGGESRRIRAKAPVQSPEVRLRGKKSPPVERRRACALSASFATMPGDARRQRAR